jgi:hypothetical protein
LSRLDKQLHAEQANEICSDIDTELRLHPDASTGVPEIE